MYVSTDIQVTYISVKEQKGFPGTATVEINGSITITFDPQTPGEYRGKAYLWQLLILAHPVEFVLQAPKTTSNAEDRLMQIC